MNKCHRVLMAMAIAVVAASSEAIAGMGSGGIPLPVGQFSVSIQGSIALCLDPTTFAQESCGTSGALVFSLSVVSKGSTFQDEAGNACETYTEVDSALPLNASPPTITNNEHVVDRTSDYNPMTGIGNDSFVVYTGGSCNGSRFNNAGATEIASGTGNFVVSENGNRFDGTFTSLTNPTSSVGNFTLSATAIKQLKRTQVR